jgi:hypothetical protein
MKRREKHRLNLKKEQRKRHRKINSRKNILQD